MKLNKILLEYNPMHDGTSVEPGTLSRVIHHGGDYHRHNGGDGPYWFVEVFCPSLDDVDMVITTSYREFYDEIKDMSDNFIELGMTKFSLNILCYITNEEALALKLLSI